MLVTILHNVFCVTNVGNLFLYQQKYRFMLLKCMMTLVTRTNEISMIFSGAKILIKEEDFPMKGDRFSWEIER